MGQDNFVVEKFKRMNPVSRWITVGTAAAALLLLPAGLHHTGIFAEKPPATDRAAKPAAPKPAATAVTSLGRLEPLGEVIQISAPSTQSGKGTLSQLLVKEGDQVNKGQVIAILDSRQRLEASLAKAQEDVKVSQNNLAKVRAGAKQGEIGAQQAEIDRLKSQLQGYRDSYVATKARLVAQLKWDPAAQTGKIEALNAQLAGEKPTQAATIRRLQSQLKNTEVDYKRYQQLSSMPSNSKSIPSANKSPKLNLNTTRLWLLSINRLSKIKPPKIELPVTPNNNSPKLTPPTIPTSPPLTNKLPPPRRP
jgi:HlyD family secretion protein